MEEPDKLGIQSILEQEQESLVNMARLYSVYFKELRGGGFSRDEAFRMTLDLQKYHQKNLHDE